MYEKEAGSYKPAARQDLWGATYVVGNQGSRDLKMSGNQGVGISGGGEGERFEAGAVESVAAPVSETIYVGRASFRVALDEPLDAEGQVASGPNTTAWFRPPAADRERTAIVNFGDRLNARRASDRMPLERVVEDPGPPARRFAASRWSIGLPLTFGAFFCGLMVSPLASSSFSRREKAATPTTALPPPLQAAPAAVPVVAPIAPIVPLAPPAAPVEPPRAQQLNLVAAAARTEEPATTKFLPVQGRAGMKKSSVRKTPAPRRPSRAGASSGSDSSTADPRAWVDPWADS